MAPSVKHLLFLLVVLFLFTFYCPQIHARESQYFSKFTLHHNNLNQNTSSSNITTSSTITANTTTHTINPNKETKQVVPKEEAPLPKLNEEPTTSYTPENENGHGLYGDQGSTQFPPTTMTTTTNSLAEARAPTDGDYIDATYEDNNNNNNPDTLTNGPSETPTNEYTGATYEENENSNNRNNRNNNWSGMMKKQGMSDTRFMENGRYSYANTNLYGNNEYGSPSLKGNNEEGFGSSSRGEMDNNYNAAADNTFDDDEFNNYMEEAQFSDNINDQYAP